jgi:hypothetical protein
LADFGAFHSFAGRGSQMISPMSTFFAVVPITVIDRGLVGDHSPSSRLT